MVAAAAAAAAAAPRSLPLSAEEEALKRNTDCLYFLASPLTCKKGFECDYRHSGMARANPRDCWFWLNGNCLNPKCAFRHPPLDGMLGTQMPTSTSTPHVENATSKAVVPCKYFQNGFCLKGDWCPFLHAPNPAKNKASLIPVAASTSNKVEISVHEKKLPPTNTDKPIKDSPDSQVAGEVEPAIVRNELSKIEGISGINEHPYYITLPVSNENLASWSNCVHQPHLDEPGMMDTQDAGENSREPSPGFDVLVDDEVRDSDVYRSEDHYGILREYEYDINHLTDYKMLAEGNNGRRKDSHSYDSNGHHNSHYGLEQNRASSDRISKRRPYGRDNSRGEVYHELDLRHHLARSEHLIGLMHVINDDDRSYQGMHRHETPFSSRLQGRIRLPQRSSSPTDRGINNGWKKHRVRRDMISDDNADFDSPKSLAELKNRKIAKPSGKRVMDQQQLSKKKYDGHQQNGNNLSFDGPKPLDEILKRKRGGPDGTLGNGNSSMGGDVIQDNDQKECNKKPSRRLVSSTVVKNEVVFSASAAQVY